jgi:hypothetical protein
MIMPISETQSLETLRLLYPIFKEEVYKRRAAMAAIARQGAFFFLSLSLLSLFLLKQSAFSTGLRGLACAGVLLTLLLLVHQIRQEKSRHEKAKLQLIRLERGLQFFEEGTYLPEGPLYPQEWQERPKIDADLAISVAILAGTAFLLVLIILLA